MLLVFTCCIFLGGGVKSEYRFGSGMYFFSLVKVVSKVGTTVCQ